MTGSMLRVMKWFWFDPATGAALLKPFIQEVADTFHAKNATCETMDVDIRLYPIVFCGKGKTVCVYPPVRP